MLNESKYGIEDAFETASRISGVDKSLLKIFEQMPENFHIYSSLNYSDQPCWFVYVPHDCQCMLKSGRVIVISRLSGEILYDGSVYSE